MKPIRKDEQEYLRTYIGRKFDNRRSTLESERQVDVDPVPGTKEFAKELRETEIKYKRLRRKYESYRKSNKYIA